MSWPPTDEEIQNLPIDELAMRLLVHLVAIHPTGPGANETSRSHFQQGSNRYQLTEAFDWLMNHGLVADNPGSSAGWQFITRLGRRVGSRPRPTEAFRFEERLALDLHPTIHERVRRCSCSASLRAAVLLATREVEIRVRHLAGEPSSSIGAPLMRKAFNPDNGPLADLAVDPGERVGVMELFAGAMGSFKNPSSHRPVDYGDPTIASEVVLFADLLLRMLDRVEERLTRSGNSASVSST